MNLKTLIIPYTILLMAVPGLAQNIAINSDGEQPHPSAILDLQSTDKGLLIPRMPASERKGIADPAPGLLVFQNDAKQGFFYYDGIRWRAVDEAGQTANITDIDGNSYEVVQIGEQVWMAENLMAGHFRNGDPIPKTTSSAAWASIEAPALVAYNSMTKTYKPTFGLLYNAHTAADMRGICPPGWDVPSESDWQTLIDYLGDKPGGKLKSISEWALPNQEALNSKGFAAKPGGYRDEHGIFTMLRHKAAFWAKPPEAGSSAPLIFLQNDSGQAYSAQWPSSRGASIRCIRIE